MRILVNQHPHYNYMDATVCQGLQNLGHEVYSHAPGTNYVERVAVRTPMDLFIQFMRNGNPLPNMKSIIVWGEDDQTGLEAVFTRGFSRVFVRDHLSGQPGIPMNFGAEDRYYCATQNGIKPLRDREIDVCFLGQLWNHRAALVEKLKHDFKDLNLVLGPRRFNTPDKEWSRWTLPYCAHDPAYFEMLANSKICLSLRGAGPDCARHWEAIASGGIPVIEMDGIVDIVRPTPSGVRWFSGYEQLQSAIHNILARIDTFQTIHDADWSWNREHHSTMARARYLLRECGFSEDAICAK